MHEHRNNGAAKHSATKKVIDNKLNNNNYKTKQQECNLNNKVQTKLS